MKILNRKTALIIVLVLIPLICVGVGFWILAEFRAAARSAEENWVTTDLAQYSQIRNGFEWDNKLTEHFPEQIPSNATDIHLMYSPPFMQKGANFQLRFKLPPSEIERLLAEYGEVAKQKYEGHQGGASDYMHKSYLPLPPFHINDDPGGTILPKDYVIIVLGAEPRGQEDFLWNHGYTYGVAINESISEILYWAEYW
jgi:hypothetical protein